MINLVFDLSNIFFRSLYITGGYGKKIFTFDNQQETDKLMRKVSTDVSYIIRQTNPSRVIFALDSKSWRKKISIDENEGYKAHREKSSFFNWDNIFNTLKEFSEILDSNGFIISKIENSEADDIISLWKDELLYKHNQHVIIVSSDEDVRQLVKFWPYEPGKKVFSTVFNPFSTGKNSSKKLFIPRHFNEWINNKEEGDIFNRAIDVDKEDFRRLRDKDKVMFEEIDGDYIAMKKIFCGDDGDNIPSIFSWIVKDSAGNIRKNKKGEEMVSRITKSKFEKIIDYISASDYYDLMEKTDTIYDQLVNISGQRPPFNMEDRLMRQIKLVVLAREIFPKIIVESFDEHVQEQLQRQNINPQECNMNSILEGTRYINTSSRKFGNESSIFKEVDRLNKELF